MNGGSQRALNLVHGEPGVDEVAAGNPPDSRARPHGLPSRIVTGEAAHALVPGEKGFETCP